MVGDFLMTALTSFHVQYSSGLTNLLVAYLNTINGILYSFYEGVTVGPVSPGVTYLRGFGKNPQAPPRWALCADADADGLHPITRKAAERGRLASDRTNSVLYRVTLSLVTRVVSLLRVRVSTRYNNISNGRRAQYRTTGVTTTVCFSIAFWDSRGSLIMMFIATVL